MTRLIDLMTFHEKEVISFTTKHLNNIHWKFNPNDVGRLLEQPKFHKQFGRAKRVYLELANLTEHPHPF